MAIAGEFVSAIVNLVVNAIDAAGTTGRVITLRSGGSSHVGGEALHAPPSAACYLDRVRPSRSLGALGIALACASCGLVSGLGDLTRADDESGDAASEGATLDAANETASDAGSGDAGPDGQCPGTAGPTPVRVGAFCIDSTEVTNADYKAFLTAGTAPDAGPSVCAYKTTHVPDNNWPPAFNKLKLPVAYIDWCDAYDYCAWAGKRLCGRVGGGSVATSAVNDSTDQWFYACSHGADGKHDFPYGNSFDPAACNVPEHDAGVVPVHTLAGCTGGFPGIFDMGGNVYEWEDACDGALGKDDSCSLRGGSFIDPPGPLQDCASSHPGGRSLTDLDIGARCCSGP